MNPFSPRRRVVPGQSRPDGLHLERVPDKPETHPEAGPWQARELTTAEMIQLRDATRRAMDPPKPTADGPVTARLRQLLDEIRADRDRLDLANERLVAKVRTQAATITDLTTRLGETN